jgi:hypothetical protein
MIFTLELLIRGKAQHTRKFRTDSAAIDSLGDGVME